MSSDANSPLTHAMVHIVTIRHVDIYLVLSGLIEHI